MQLSSVKSQIQKAYEDSSFNWNMPDVSGQQVSLRSITQEQYRLIKISEISESNAKAYRIAMGNVLSILNGSDASLVYVLSGTTEGVDLYFGVVKKEGSNENIADTLSLLESSINGNFLGASIERVATDSNELENIVKRSSRFGYAVGVPNLNEESNDDEEFQGIERLVNSLSGESWQLVVVAEPNQGNDVEELLDQIYNLSTELSIHIKDSYQLSENSGTSTTSTQGDNWSDTTGHSHSTALSKNKGISESHTSSKGESRGQSSQTNSSNSHQRGTSSGSSESVTRGTNNSNTKGGSSSLAVGSNAGESQSITKEKINKSYEEMQKHLSETLIERFRIGRSKGMFRTSIYFGAANQQVYQRLTQSVKSIFQGNQSNVTPLKVYEMKGYKPKSFGELFQSQTFSNQELIEAEHSNLLTHGISFNAMKKTVSASSWLNTSELAILTSFPSKELPGIKLRKSVDFAVNTGSVEVEESFQIGHVVHHGRILETSPVRLPLKDLNKHVFVAGVTGAGKTTTCMKLLIDSNLPFMVIEPAKTEYRALYAQGKKDGFEVDYYPLGREDVFPFRLNPFELVHAKQSLMGHISVLTSTLVAVYPMEAAMPQIVEEAIILAYEERGWNITSNWNYLYDDPFDKASNGEAWPTFSDLLNQLRVVIKSKGMGAEFEEKYEGSLVAKITNLTEGVKGVMLNTRHSLDFESLLDKKVVIELEEMKGEQDKSILMGFIITRLAEAMKIKHARQADFQHLTLIEEAHRLLSRVDPGESESKKYGVEMFANLLAEVRKYGEGLIIADQSPMKLIPDVIKNTHAKIIHRLYEQQDRTAVANAMSMDEDQSDFLPNLKTGETVVYCGGWHAPVRVQIEETIKTDDEQLSDGLLVEKGKAQMWAQLRFISPQFANLSFVNNGNFNQLYQQSKALVFLMVKFQKSLIQGKECEKQSSQVKHLCKKINEVVYRLKLKEDDVVALIKNVLTDSVTLNTDTQTYLEDWIKTVLGYSSQERCSFKEQNAIKELIKISI